MKTEIIVTVLIPGFHYWEDAHLEVEFLNHKHLHNFRIVAYKEVHHGDREVEFFEFSSEILDYLNTCYPSVKPSLGVLNHAVDFGTRSCEQIAEEILKQFSLSICEVWEDEYVGAKVYA